MRKSLLSLLFVLFCYFLNAQRLHTPSEVQQYMEKSNRNFSMDTLTAVLPIKKLTLVKTGNFLIITDDGYALDQREFSLSSSGKKYLAKAKKFERKNKVPKSIKYLKKAHDMHPENMRVMKFLASLYLENEQTDRAIFLLEKVIEINEIDYEAHSLVAVAYHKIGKSKKALEHISLAHLLNRNHQKVIELLKVIYLENGLLYADHLFDPQYRIQSKDSVNISIQANEEPWKAYAACKGLWDYEAQYKKEMMNFSNVDLSTVEQKECLLNALLNYESMEKGKDAYPLLAHLGVSLQNEMVNEFILYEINSREHPEMMSLLPKEKLHEVMRYLMTIRVGQEVGMR